MIELISLADVLLLMKTTADPFDVVFSTADVQRGTGGELVRLTGCLATATTKQQAAAKAPSPPATPPGTPAVATGGPAYQPAHQANQTLNVTVLSSGHTRKLHPRLIVEFNGKKVRW